MKRQYENMPRIYEILDEMAGKNTTRQIRDRLLQEGLLPSPDIDAFWDECVRDVVERHGRKRMGDGEIQLRLFNLKEMAEDGTIQHYYKSGQELSEAEGIQLLEAELKAGRRQARKCWDIFDMLAGMYGKKRIMRQLRFSMPERSREAEPAI